MPDTPAYRPAPLFARFYEWISRRRFFAAQFEPLRRELAQMSRGRVLEVGAGGGQNFPYYDPARVSAVEATEPDGTMLRYLRAHLQDSRVPIHVTEATAEHLPFDAHSFDTVQTTMVLCSVGDLGATLAEIARVLKPDGRLLLLEHVRSPRRGLAALQTAFTPIQRRVAGNCHLNRDMASALRDAGYAIETERRYGGGMFPLRLYAARPRLDGEPERVVDGPQTSPPAPLLVGEGEPERACDAGSPAPRHSWLSVVPPPRAGEGVRGGVMPRHRLTTHCRCN